MKSHWIVYNGKRIWYSDCTNCGLDSHAVKTEMDYAFNMISTEPKNSVLSLTNVSDTRGTPEIFRIFKNAASKFEPFVIKRAVVGITGSQKTFIELLNKMSGTKSFKLFDDLDQAKLWLSEN
ncbi:MAG: hypothetical protein CL609_14875 [Anaerolineaceae bacterium]|nr:hypothetical protein [Anaerolineaceae bacterium]